MRINFTEMGIGDNFINLYLFVFVQSGFPLKAKYIKKLRRRSKAVIKLDGAKDLLI